MQMSVQFRQIAAFLELVRMRSFGKAAAQLGLSQPAFSLSIQRLEESLGARLFDRTSRTVSLTREGEAFLPLARRLAETWDATFTAMDDIVSVRRGRVAVAALPSLAAIILPEVTTRFHRSHPDIDVEIRDVLHEEVIELVRSGRVDFGLSIGGAEGDALTLKPFLRDRFVLLARRDHGLSQEAVVSWEQAARYPFVMMTRVTSVRRAVEQAIAARGLAVPVASEVNQLATVGGLVRAGFGIAALPALCLPIVMGPELAWVPLGDPAMERRIGIIEPRQVSLSLAAQAFLADLRSLPKAALFDAFPGEVVFEEPDAPLEG